jgi:hypothetical protein
MRENSGSFDFDNPFRPAAARDPLVGLGFRAEILEERRRLLAQLEAAAQAGQDIVDAPVRTVSRQREWMAAAEAWTAMTLYLLRRNLFARQHLHFMNARTHNRHDHAHAFSGAHNDMLNLLSTRLARLQAIAATTRELIEPASLDA